MKLSLLILVFGLMSAGAPASAGEPIFATITVKDVILYESPSTTSPVVRRVFPGEVLKITETIKNEKGSIWGKVFLSPTQEAFIQGVYFTNSGSLDQKLWKPQDVLRGQMPFSFAAKGPGEYFGPGLQFRYLPFTRLGLTVGAGSVIDRGRSRGFSLAYGLSSVISMKNFSPFVETGSTTLTFNDGHASLKVSSFYINAGVEWILRSGYFMGAGVSYIRSYNVQVSYDYGYAKASNGNIALGDFGSFSGLNGSESLERLNPIFFAGYSF